jgi:hypothetical protein
LNKDSCPFRRGILHQLSVLFAQGRLKFYGYAPPNREVAEPQ